MSTLKTHKCITVLSLRKLMLVKGHTRCQVKHKNQAILIHGKQQILTGWHKLHRDISELRRIFTDEWPAQSSSSQKRQPMFLKERNDGKPYREGTRQGLQTEQTAVWLRLRKERGPGILVWQGKEKFHDYDAVLKRTPWGAVQLFSTL